MSREDSGGSCKEIYTLKVFEQGCDLPQLVVPLVKSFPHSEQPRELEVGNQASYEVGCDCTLFSTAQSRPLLQSTL